MGWTTKTGMGNGSRHDPGSFAIPLKHCIVFWPLFSLGHETERELVM